MKTTIIGGGNMGSAIALGLAAGDNIRTQDITVIDHNQNKVDKIKAIASEVNIAVNDYSSLKQAEIIILAVKPWLIEQTLKTQKKELNPKQIIISIAAGIGTKELSEWTFPESPIYIVIPNTAIAIRQSLTSIVAHNTTKAQDKILVEMFDELGKAMLIEEKLLPAVMVLSSCGIAFAFRYIRAAMEGGIQMGVRPDQGRDILIQTLRGAVELLEANNSHPETEIDKVTTPGGITIKGLNEMEHAGFTSSVIKGLMASYSK